MILHASCVALDGAGLLILGPSGSGKSSLALELISRGAVLVSDDRTVIAAQHGVLQASAPATISGLIEARGIGILRMDCMAVCPVTCAVDLSQTETARLPPARSLRLLDLTIPCVHKVDAPHFPAAICAYLRGKPEEDS